MGDNKTLRTKHESRQFVIMIMRNGVRKYLSRERGKNFNFTVLLNRARRFQNENQALKYAEFLGIEYRCEVVPVTVEIRLEENGCKLLK